MPARNRADKENTQRHVTFNQNTGDRGVYVSTPNAFQIAENLRIVEQRNMLAMQTNGAIFDLTGDDDDPPAPPPPPTPPRRRALGSLRREQRLQQERISRLGILQPRPRGRGAQRES